MRRGPVLLLLLALTATPSGAKVRVDFDAEADFSSYETFQWKRSPRTLDEEWPLIHSQIVRIVEAQLDKAGLREVDADPDLYVIYHAGKSSSLVVDTNQVGYDMGPAWHWDPYWNPWTGSAHLRSYKEGTLVIDLVDARQDRIIWRGTTEGMIPADRDALGRKIEVGVEKMVRKFRKQYRR